MRAVSSRKLTLFEKLPSSFESELNKGWKEEKGEKGWWKGGEGEKGWWKGEEGGEGKRGGIKNGGGKGKRGRKRRNEFTLFVKPMGQPTVKARLSDSTFHCTNHPATCTR